MSLNEIIAALREGRITADEADAEISELAYIDACERVGPNAVGFDTIWGNLTDQYRLSAGQ